mgnify:CR=1 FL=1
MNLKKVFQLLGYINLFGTVMLLNNKIAEKIINKLINYKVNIYLTTLKIL